MRLTDRIRNRLERDFGPSKAGRARYVIEAVDIGHDETPLSERIQAAMLLSAGGNLDRLLEAAALAETDWRDLLVNTDLANEDWPQRVDVFLAPPTPGSPAVRPGPSASRRSHPGGRGTPG